MDTRNLIIMVGNRYVSGVFGIGGWKFPVSTSDVDSAENFDKITDAYDFIREFKLNNALVLDYDAECKRLGIKSTVKRRFGQWR